jgi:lysophospholipase L1-like esterase
MVVNDGVTSGLEGIAEVLAEGPAPDLWVIALGSNDVANYDADEYPAAIGEMLAAIPPDAPLVWVDCYLEDYEDESAAFDSALREVLAERGNAAVVDWASVAAGDGVLSDNVHPSGFGRGEFARRVIDGVDAWIG